MYDKGVFQAKAIIRIALWGYTYGGNSRNGE